MMTQPPRLPTMLVIRLEDVKERNKARLIDWQQCAAHPHWRHTTQPQGGPLRIPIVPCPPFPTVSLTQVAVNSIHTPTHVRSALIWYPTTSQDVFVTLPRTTQTPMLPSVTFQSYRRRQHIPIHETDRPTSSSSMKAFGLATNWQTVSSILINCVSPEPPFLTTPLIATTQYPFTAMILLSPSSKMAPICSLTRPLLLLMNLTLVHT